MNRNIPIRILLVDDSPYFLEAARDFLSYQETFEVAGSASEGGEALARALELQPDVILLDLNLARGSGLKLIPLFKERLPGAKVIVLTMMEETSYRPAALQAGADGFVHKALMSKNLPPLIKSLMGREEGANGAARAGEGTGGAANGGYRFLRLAEFLPDLIYRYEFAPKRGFTYVSPSAASLTGYTPEEHYADPDLGFKLVHPDDRHLLEGAAQGKSDPHKPLELRWVRKDGTVLWTEQRNVNIYNADGTLTALEGIARDITERKRAEEELRKTEDRFRSYIRNANDYIFTLSPSGGITSANEAMCEALGYAEADLLGRSALELIPAEHQMEAAQALSRIWSGETVDMLEVPVRTSGGETIMVQIRGRSIYEGGRLVETLHIARDISAQKRAGEALRASEERFRALFENSPVAIWDEDFSLVKARLDDLARGGVTDLEAYFTEHEEFVEECVRLVQVRDVNRAALSLYQIDSKEELLGSLYKTFPEDALRSFKNELSAIARGDSRYRAESSVRPFQGNERNVLVDWVAPPGYERDYSKVLVSLTDITQQKQVEDSLNRSERRFRALVENGSDEVSILSADGSLLYESPSANPTLGYRPGEFIGQSLIQLTHPEDAERIGNAFARLARDASLHPREQFRLRHRDGHWVWVEAVGTNLLDDPAVGGIVINYHDITERRQAEDSLRWTEQFHHSILEDITEMIIRFLPDGTLTYVNDAYCRYYGKSRDELIGSNFIAASSADFEPKLREHLDSFSPDNPFSRFEQYDLLPDGGKRWREWVDRALFDAEGKLVEFQSTGRDITERKQTELELSRRADELEVLHEITNDLALELDVQTLLEMIAERMDLLLDSSGGFIYLYDHVRDELVLTNATEQAMPLGTRLKMGEGLAGRVAALRQPLIVDDYHAWENKAKAYEDKPFRSVVEVPMLSGGELIGVLGVEALDDSSRKFNGNDARLLSLFAGHAAAAVRNVRLLETLQLELAERKKTEAALRESEERVRNIIRHSNSMFYTHTPDHRLTYVSLQSRELLDCEPEEAMVRWQEFLSDHPANRAGVESTERAIQTGERQPPYELELVTRKGRKVWVRVDESPVLRDGRTAAIVGSITDITERKLAEERLASSEARYRELFESNPHPMWVYDLETLRFLAVNDAAVLHYGYSRGEFYGMTIKDIRPSGEVPRLLENIAHVTAGSDEAGIWSHIKKNGEVIDVEITSHVLTFDDRRAEMVLAHDVTERMRAEAKLRASENRYRFATKATNDVIWEWDLSTDELFWSENAQSVFGYASEEIDQRERWWQDHVHPQDLPRVQDELNAILVSDGIMWQAEYRFLRRDGSYIDISDRGYIERDGSGKAVRMIGAMSDITGRKKSQEQIERRMVELEALYQSGIAFSRTLDPVDIGEKIIEVLAGRLDWHHAAVRARRGETNEVELLAFSRSDEQEIESRVRSTITRVGHGMAGWVIEHGRSLRSADLENDPRYVATYPGMRSGLYVPIKIFDKTIGCINVESDLENAFSEEDERLLATIALQAAVALENARMYTSALLSTRRRDVLYEAGQQMVRVTQDREELYAALHRAAAQLMPAEAFTIVLYHAERNVLESAYLFDKGGRWDAPDIPLGEGFSSRVIASGKTILNNDLLKTPLPTVFYGTEEEVRSVLAVPLRSGNRVIGAISTQSYEPEAFTEEDRYLLEMLAAQAAIAFENTRLFQNLEQELKERERAEREIERRAEEFSALYEAARSLAGETDLQKVLQAILDQSVSLLGTANGTIALYDEESDELALAALKNFPARLGDRRKMGEGMAGIAAQTRQPLIVDDYRTWERRNTILDDVPLSAAIEVPLIYHDELIGTLGVGETNSARKFTETDVRLLSLIGAHAAGAVENARLFQFLQNELNERRQAEKALAESEARYRSLVEQLPAIVYLDDLQVSTPTTRLVSPRIEDFLGIPPQEWLAGGIEIWKQSIHPDDLERALEGYFDSIMNDAAYSQEYRMIARDGRILWVRDTATIQRNERGEPVSMQGVIYDITENKNAESTMRLQSAALETVANAIVITDTEGTIQWVNPAYTQLTGYSAGEVFGKNPRILQSGVQDREFYKNLWDTILSGRVWRGELVNKRKDGTLYHEEQSITPLFDSNGNITHFIGIKQDITSRKQTEERIMRQLEHIAALREIDQVIASSFDMEFSLNVIVAKAIELLKVDAATVLLIKAEAGTLEYAAGMGFRSPVSKTASVFIGESYAGLAVLERRPVQIPDLAGAPDNKFMFGFLKDEGFASYYGVPLIVKGQVLGVLEVFSRSVLERDEEWLDYLNTLAGQAAIAVDNALLFSASQYELAERKLAEERLRLSHAELEKRIEERTADLRQLNDELERALRVKDEFLANMSHELRTPLNAVIGLSDSLAEQTAGTLNEKQQKYVSTIRESGQHLLDLINDILDLAKIEAGQVTLDRTPVDVLQVCQSSLRMVKQLARKKNQEISFEMDADLKSIHADARRLKQMIVNLLSNAVKFTPENGKIGLELRGDRENNTALFTVWDSGIGIEEKDLPLLFKPFVQLDSNLARQSTGTGLGLSLVAKMAAFHGGSVSVESQPGMGSRFTITLPWKQLAKTGPLSADDAGVVLAPASEAKGHKILLVDDTEEVVQLFKDYLEYAGYKVTVARNGVEGVSLAEEIKPGLILMDIQMPVMDGLEATRRIRKIEALKDTPIIALTALAMKGDRDRCIEAGMNDYLSKPVNLKTLTGTIGKHLTAAQEPDAE